MLNTATSRERVRPKAGVCERGRRREEDAAAVPSSGKCGEPPSPLPAVGGPTAPNFLSTRWASTMSPPGVVVVSFLFSTGRDHPKRTITTNDHHGGDPGISPSPVFPASLSWPSRQRWWCLDDICDNLGPFSACGEGGKGKRVGSGSWPLERRLGLLAEVGQRVDLLLQLLPVPLQRFVLAEEVHAQQQRVHSLRRLADRVVCVVCRV